MVTQNKNKYVQATMINPLQIRLSNHTKLIAKKKKKKEKTEEKEESEILCLKIALLLAIHLDRYDSRGRQDRGAPSPSEEL